MMVTNTRTTSSVSCRVDSRESSFGCFLPRNATPLRKFRVGLRFIGLRDIRADRRFTSRQLPGDRPPLVIGRQTVNQIRNSLRQLKRAIQQISSETTHLTVLQERVKL
jgi:hypothetical protein